MQLDLFFFFFFVDKTNVWIIEFVECEKEIQVDRPILHKFYYYCIEKD
jgi:hypothetical protein